MKRKALLSFVALLAAGLLLTVGCKKKEPISGEVKDEAMLAGRAPNSFPPADEDYFHDMDQTAHGVLPLNVDEVKGRNMWIVWTGGDDRLWDVLTDKSIGTLDFLKTLSSHPSLKFGRHNRWNYLGVVNEPCFEEAKGPDKDRYGLWLDHRRTGPDCPPDPFENEKKYPGVAYGSRGKNMPLGSYYGYATGVVGLRLFPNPDFDEAASKKWDAERFYKDPAYYNNKDLVRPYRVGMSCGFCHVGPNPIKPPTDPENPTWANLSSNVGAQYFWVDRVFSWEADESAFVYQFFHTNKPGSLDTSLVSTDNIINPRTMNAVYQLAPRLKLAERWGKETLAGGGLNNKQFNDFLKEGWLTDLYKAPNTSYSPRVLKDGSDSVGGLGALNRVYMNIGLFSEDWLLHFNALVGGKKVSPIEIAVARKNSSYWGATELSTIYMAEFFLKSTDPHHLADAPGGPALLSKDAAQLKHGKEVFADRCARCHSSKAPANPIMDAVQGGSGPKYLEYWDKYWAWTKTDDFKKQMREIVMKPDFLTDNYLSTELRVPSTLMQTNACSPLATNAIENNIWDNFSSRTYKDLPSVGKVTVYHPVTGEPEEYQMPAGGRGYTRPASLVSVWSTAPFLQNNTVGHFEASPSVEARMKSFNDSIEQMLWPEKRDKDWVLGDKVPGMMERTPRQTYLRVPAGYLPDILQALVGLGSHWFPWLFGEDGIEIGPIPTGTVVALLGNLNLTPDDLSGDELAAHNLRLVNLLLKAKHDLKQLEKSGTGAVASTGHFVFGNITSNGAQVTESANDADLRKVFANLVGSLKDKTGLYGLSKCPDYVVNKGHYFGTDMLKEKDNPEPGLSDADKRALIEFLKTF